MQRPTNYQCGAVAVRGIETGERRKISRESKRLLEEVVLLQLGGRSTIGEQCLGIVWTSAPGWTALPDDARVYNTVDQE